MALRRSVPFYQFRGSQLVQSPSTEPVSLLDMKSYLRIESDDEDAILVDQIIEARRTIEENCGIAFITQSWRLSLDRWPAGGEAWWDGIREAAITELYNSNTFQSLALPRFPLQSITSVTVYDEASAATVVNVASTFDVDTYQTPGRLTLKRGKTWPVALRANDAIQIVYVAGYTSASNVPAPMKRAVKQLAAFLYSHRGDDCDPKDAYMASGADSLMAGYKAMRV